MVATLAERLAQLETVQTPIGAIKPLWGEDRRGSASTRRVFSGIELGGRTLNVSGRFMESLWRCFRIGPVFFRYYAPQEVFSRIQEVHPRSRVRLVIDGNTALGMSDPQRPVVGPAELCRVLKAQGDRLVSARYEGGVVISVHSLDEADWRLGRDVFRHTCTFETPLDGLGLPSVYLSLIRQVCANGVIGYARVFRTEVSLGRRVSDGAAGPLARAMDCYSNEEGCAALRQRLQSARRSEASVHEVRTFSRALARAVDPRRRKDLEPVCQRLSRLTGDLSLKYGVAGEDAVSSRRQRMLPMDCTVYDLITAATEITTHHADKLSEPYRLHAWVGGTLADEYDLEGSLEPSGSPEPPPFFFN